MIAAATPAAKPIANSSTPQIGLGYNW